MTERLPFQLVNRSQKPGPLQIAPVYLRHTTVNKYGKTRSYWCLVRSVRRGRKVFQETVAHLGELDAHDRARARRLTLDITGKREQYLRNKHQLSD